MNGVKGASVKSDLHAKGSLGNLGPLAGKRNGNEGGFPGNFALLYSDFAEYHPFAMSEISKAYEPQSVEEKWYARWLEDGCFAADPA
jgi:hypothetical protein